MVGESVVFLHRLWLDFTIWGPWFLFFWILKILNKMSNWALFSSIIFKHIVLHLWYPNGKALRITVDHKKPDRRWQAIVVPVHHTVTLPRAELSDWSTVCRTETWAMACSDLSLMLSSMPFLNLFWYKHKHTSWFLLLCSWLWCVDAFSLCRLTGWPWTCDALIYCSLHGLPGWDPHLCMLKHLHSTPVCLFSSTHCSS